MSFRKHVAADTISGSGGTDLIAGNCERQPPEGTAQRAIRAERVFVLS
jgi:hypothetical protein